MVCKTVFFGQSWCCCVIPLKSGDLLYALWALRVVLGLPSPSLAPSSFWAEGGGDWNREEEEEEEGGRWEEKGAGGEGPSLSIWRTSRWRR